MLSSEPASRAEDMAHANCGTVGRGARAPAHAKKGLAADLINKFNQLSAVGRAASLGRGAAGRSQQAAGRGPQGPVPLDDVRPVSRHSATPQAEAEAGRCPLLGARNNAAENPDRNADADAQRPSHRRAGGGGVGGGGGPARTSVFLTDSELDHALSEIREFGRNMNLSLCDDADHHHHER
ncbi:hypothetical protein H4R18_002250 [Coemansia javaensis]|uniref:Uncharacterized protein n=1 Tax=Coemansia javaensis TaxID=2761396 RepID=A0A9W8LI05_9FUNG|nr:hypothetical protein H4R18_002250 [Coemansia javaensis]